MGPLTNAGAPQVFGTAGDDTLYGGLVGQAREVYGLGGNDSLHSAGGVDYLSGDDFIDAGDLCHRC